MARGEDRDPDLSELYLRDIHRAGPIEDGAPPPRTAFADRNGRNGTTPAAERDVPPPAAGERRRRLIEQHLGLVVVIAGDYRRLGAPLGLARADLIQEENLGLLEAADRFDAGRSGPFCRYAAGRIRQRICRALSQQSRTIRIPLRRLALRRHAAQVAADADQRCGNRACDGGRRPDHTVDDDARELGVSPEELRVTLRLVPEVEPLEGPAAADECSPLQSLPNPRSPDPCEQAADSEQRERLPAALSRLPERLRRIVEGRYGLRGDEDAGLAEIGNELHLSAERVRQLQKKALGLLRADPGLREPSH